MIRLEEIQGVVVPGGFFDHLLQSKIMCYIKEMFIYWFVITTVFYLSLISHSMCGRLKYSRAHIMLELGILEGEDLKPCRLSSSFSLVL